MVASATLQIFDLLGARTKSSYVASEIFALFCVLQVNKVHIGSRPSK